MNYTKSQSFYESKEFFDAYLGCTSYYRILQAVTSKIVRMTNAENILELGTGFGTTSIKLAKEYRDKCTVHGIDFRERAIAYAKDGSYGLVNASFEVADMCEIVKDPLDEYDLIFMLYSFHHIEDPIMNKVDFLGNCFHNMKPGSYILIGETFEPESKPSWYLFNERGEEGYASTFWNSLNSISDEDIKNAKYKASICEGSEKSVGRNVETRDNEFLVTFGWLVKTAVEIGFKTVLAEPVNAFMDKVALFRKPEG